AGLRRPEHELLRQAVLERDGKTLELVGGGEGRRGMNEAEWLTCGDPKLMLAHLRGRVSDRKLGLFAVSCCCRIWYLLPRWGQKDVEIAELFADGLASAEEMTKALQALPADRRWPIGVPGPIREWSIDQTVAGVLSQQLDAVAVA